MLGPDAQVYLRVRLMWKLLLQSGKLKTISEMTKDSPCMTRMVASSVCWHPVTIVIVIIVGKQIRS